MTKILKKTDFSNLEKSKITERLSTPMSIVNGTNPNVVQIISLGELVNDLQRTDAKRDYVRTLVKEQPEEYRKLKSTWNSSLKGFISGRFSKRSDSSCDLYIPLLVFDIDGVVSLDDTLSIIEEAKKDKYVFAAFPSPSGLGCRLLIWSGATIKTHIKYYKEVSKYLSIKLKISTNKDLEKQLPHLDSSTSNISRHFYYTPVGDELYLNKDSKTFIMSDVNNDDDRYREKPTHIKYILIYHKQELIEGIVRQSGKGRNSTTYDFACMSFENGVSLADTISYCLKFEELHTSEKFDRAEIERTVKSAFKKVSSASGFGKYNDEQLIHYAKKELGEHSVNAILGVSVTNRKNDITKAPNVEKEEEEKSVKFPIECLPPTIQKVIIEMNKAYQLPIDFYGLSMLTVCGGIIGNNLKAMYKNYTVPSVIFSAIVGEVSMGKSPAIDFCFEPVYEINRELLKKYREKYAAWLQDGDGEKPAFQKLIVQDATTEAINKNFINGSTGLIYFRDELMSWLNSMNQYKGQGSDEQYWLTAWNGKSIIIDRVGNQLPFDIKNICISSIGSIQPFLLKELLKGSKKHNGFFSRILFAYPDNQKKPFDNDITPNQEIIDTYNQFIHKLYDHVREEDSSLDTTIPMTKNAEKKYRRWKNENTKLINEVDSPIIKGIYGKLENYCLRIALILEIMYVISEEDSFNPLVIEITENTVQKSIKLIEYFRHTSHKVFDRAFNFNPIEKLDECKQKLYYKLPTEKEFRRSEANTIGKNLSLSSKTVGRFLRSNPNLFRRKKQGIYIKRKID